MKIYLYTDSYLESNTKDVLKQCMITNLVDFDFVEDSSIPLSEMEDGSIILFLDYLNPRIIDYKIQIKKYGYDLKLAAMFLGYAESIIKPTVFDNLSWAVNLEKSVAECLDLLVFGDETQEKVFIDKRFVNDDKFIHMEVGDFDFSHLNAVLKNL